ncbi:DUF4142 domain-containing protein [Pseudomonas sp. NFXW11]|uniref:DUF4142 domain-containing protein n=1 Tax=Pseudomonas sp. NFXW11 TaxID=2819531 RepID=UPI003CE9A98F
MNPLATVIGRAGLALLLGLGAGNALAQSPAAFIDDASAKGMADIETSRLAHQQTSSQAVKEFSIQVINDRTTANQHLARIAKRLGLPVTPRERLLAQARARMPQLARGADFDRAYAASQIQASAAAIQQIRQQAQASELPEFKAFAEETLPKLEQHLQMARALQAGRLDG